MLRLAQREPLLAGRAAALGGLLSAGARLLSTSGRVALPCFARCDAPARVVTRLPAGQAHSSSAAAAAAAAGPPHSLRGRSLLTGGRRVVGQQGPLCAPARAQPPAHALHQAHAVPPPGVTAWLVARGGQAHTPRRMLPANSGRVQGPRAGKQPPQAAQAPRCGLRRRAAHRGGRSFTLCL